MARKQTEEPEVEQGYIDPEFAPVKNARVHKAAKFYYDAICERPPFTQAEKEAHESLLNVMLEEGVEHYVYKGVEAHVNTSKKVKVKVESATKESESNGSEE